MAFHKDLFFIFPLSSCTLTYILLSSSLHPPFGKAGVGFWHGFPGVGIFNT